VQLSYVKGIVEGNDGQDMDRFLFSGLFFFDEAKSQNSSTSRSGT
jgi:hypothetical protein